jgi:endoglucanase
MKKLYFLVVFFGLSHIASASVTVDNHIKVDQFGYRTTDKKIAVISNPQTGYNSTSPFIPGTNYEVRRASDDAMVYSGTITAWNGGATHSQSGDKVWWFDFSSFTTAGSYYVYDVTNNVRSYQFDIDDCVYSTVMKQAMRMYYYQRCGTAKAVPYTPAGWADAPCHVGSLQDTDCRLYNDTSATTSKNLSGGWHDAGDYNKYVNFTFETMTDLMLAYTQNPLVWGDDYNIPESGNGIPDILDEVKYELDWLLKMQQSNGSVLSVVGTQNYASASPPSADNAQRLYGPATTSASLTASALFALGAIQFNSIGQTAYATTLQTASVNAYTWANANPNVTFYNSGIIAAGEQEVQPYDTLVRKIAASVFLYALTGTASYKTFVESHYSQMHLILWGYAYPFEMAEQDMLLYYASLSGVTASVANSIKNNYKSSMQTNNGDNLPAYVNQTDAYRAYMADNNYTWGSNTTKGHQGDMFTDMLYYNLDAANNTHYRNAALGFINYFHGVNPTAFAYISNMGSFGAENSINEFYHSWFTDGSALWDRVGTSTYGPAPGYLPGGANPTYDVDGCCPSGCSSSNALCNATLVTPPLNQPIQKSYRDWNTNWPQDSWTVTECGIYTQAAYVRLLSWFLNAPCLTTSIPKRMNEYLFSVYPNPAEDKLTVQSQHDGVVMIFDVLGKIEVMSTSVLSGQTVIDISNLESGIYFIHFASEKGTAVWKFIKQNP